MAGDHIIIKQRVVLSENFTVPGKGITLKAGTELNVVGKSETHFQCLVDGCSLIWIPRNITRIE